MFLVANFQETAVIQVHLTGAFLYVFNELSFIYIEYSRSFGFGCIYMIIQAYISHIMVPLFASRRVAYIRSVYAGLGVILFFMG
jgi:hypothetical protein